MEFRVDAKLQPRSRMSRMAARASRRKPRSASTKDFDGGAAAWYRLQAACDAAHAMKQADRINVERMAPAGVE